MKRLALLVMMAESLAGAASQPALMPLPRHWTAQAGKLPIDGGFRVSLCGAQDPRLADAVSRLIERVSSQTGIPLHSAPAACDQATLALHVRHMTAAVPSLKDDESYRLAITSESARLDAETSIGILRGLATFTQLITADASGFGVAAMQIEDSPRFPWRGLMLDVSRHWMPVAVVKRNLEAMAAVKLNVFHWHLCDDQGFRLESRIFPKLQELASDGQFYTQDQVREVVAFAAARGIRIIPEFEMPGHASALLTAYPELASAPGPFAIERHWGIFEPLLDPTRETTYQFLDKLIGEMAALFPDDYFHIGGDEVLDTEWKKSADIQGYMRAHKLASSAALHGHFNSRLESILARHGKKMIGWDEVLQPGLSPSVMIQSWRGPDALAEAARQGHNGILSFGYYLDHLSPASFHYANDPIAGQTKRLDAAQAARILGGEACMWTEYASAETVDSRIWPRLAAIAERLWSPADVTDPESMYDRLEMVSRGLDWTGVEHRNNQLRMLERISGGAPIEPLRVLAASVEAMGIDGRAGDEKTSLTPLNRMVDAAMPESESLRLLERDARTLVAGGPDRAAAEARLTLAFTVWKNAAGQLAPSGSAYLMRDATTLTPMLARVGELGLAALRNLSGTEKIPADLVQRRKAELNAAAPQTETVLAATRTVRILLDGLSSAAHLQRSASGNP